MSSEGAAKASADDSGGLEEPFFARRNSVDGS
jgi:hypothetical protein